MKSNRPIFLFTLFLALAVLAGCGGHGGGSSSGSSSSSSSCSTPATIALPNGNSVTQAQADNVMTLTVNGSTCSAQFNAVYPNKPCVSVKICDPNNPTNCQTIDDILLDTGDYGLRIFQQVITQPGLLTAFTAPPDVVQVNGEPLYDCVEYGDSSSVWGQVVQANVTLGDSGNEHATQVPIHLIGSTTSDALSGGGHACTGQLSTVNDAGYNGSLGLGLFVQDCGSVCQDQSNNGQYFTCSGGKCTGVLTASQVANPVASLAADNGVTDNNGVIVELPSVAPTGALSADGYVIFGIGTRPNNTPSGVTAYGANSNTGYFTTAFDSVPYSGFLDTGSNGIFFTYSTTTDNGFYTPSCTLSLSATNTGASNAPNTNAVAFNIADADSLFASSNNVFSNLGGPIPNDQFDWGIPFFLGRNVYIGIEGTASSLASGPYWAY